MRQIPEIASVFCTKNYKFCVQNVKSDKVYPCRFATFFNEIVYSS